MSAELAARYRTVSQRVRGAPRPPGAPPPTLIAVSKTQPADAVEALYALGHRDFGENYAQELIAKAAVLRERGCDGLRWHFIGHLQTNKARMIAPWVHAVHSVGSLKLAHELAKRWAGPAPLTCFLEVNIDAEAAKSGAAPSETPALAREVAALPGLALQGLMAIPARGEGGAFARLRELELACRPSTRGQLSMGMSADFEDALREGATHVRLGTVIFGERG